MESFHLHPPLMPWSKIEGEISMNIEEKYVKHYSSKHEILLVGEGDFSFSLSLALGFGSASNILATSSDSYEKLINTYKNASFNLTRLGALGATLIHDVDARKMKDHPFLHWRRFDIIVYNFPHAGFYGKEDDPAMIKMHQELVSDFFNNAASLLRLNGQIHITHKTKHPYSCWNLEELAQNNSLLLMECVPFNIKDYPGYENKRGHGLASDEPFDWKDSCTFKFTHYSSYSNSFKLVQNSSHSNSFKLAQNSSYSNSSKLAQNSSYSNSIKLAQNSSYSNSIKLAQNSSYSNSFKLAQNSSYSNSFKLAQNSSYSNSFKPTQNSSYSNVHTFIEEALPRIKFVVKGEVFSRWEAGCAGALIDEKNAKILAMFWGPLPCEIHVDVAELLAIKYALLMFERSNFCGKKVELVVKSESNQAVSCIRSQLGNPEELKVELEQIKMILGFIQNCVEFCCNTRSSDRGYKGKFDRVMDELVVEGMRANKMNEVWLT